MDQARIIKALTDCDAVTSALMAEHYAIEDALQALDGAVIAGATAETLAQLMDVVVDFCVAHFANEEQEFRDQDYAGLDSHARAHKALLARFRAARDAVREGRIEGTLDAADLLNAFHNHIGTFDRPAYAHKLQQRIAAGGDTAHQQAELNQLYRTRHANGDQTTRTS
jgi:hemerythrin-like metal-binding protein